MDSIGPMHDPSTVTGEPTFDHEPLVLGLLGENADGRIAALAGRIGLRRVVSETGLTIYASARLRRWRGTGTGGWYWNPLGPQIRVRSVSDIRHHCRAAGVVRGDRWSLINDALGLQPLHYVQIGDSVVFTNWVPMLRPLIPTPRPDPVGWAGHMLLGAPIPGRSLLEGVSTLPPAAEISPGPGGPRITHHDISHPKAGTVDDLLAALRSALPRGRSPLSLTLSGGWDSRLLAALLVTSRRRAEAWTTSPDDGLDLDLDLSGPVAKRLGLDHRVVVQSESSWPSSAAEARRRFGHATWMHPWLIPLAAEVRRSGRVVVDGIGGDVLLKGLLQDPDADSQGTDPQRRSELYDRLGGSRLKAEGLWSRRCVDVFTEVGMRAFDDATDRFSDLEQWQAASILVTRTARCIALSPLRLFAPEVPVRTPFLDEAALSIALGTTIHRQRSGAFYRELIDRVVDGLGSLPSTNDPKPPGQVRSPRRQTQPEALAALVEPIRRVDAAIELLGGCLRGPVLAGDLTAVSEAIERGPALNVLQAVATFADWFETWDANGSLV